jgi:hypothetical protein
VAKRKVFATFFTSCAFKELGVAKRQAKFRIEPKVSFSAMERVSGSQVIVYQVNGRLLDTHLKAVSATNTTKSHRSFMLKTGVEKTRKSQ